MRFRFVPIVCLLLCAVVGQAGAPARVSALRRLLEAKADRYHGPGRSYCRVDSISSTSLSFTSYAGDRKSNHTESFVFQWADVSSIKMGPDPQRKGSFSVWLALRHPVDAHLSTTNEGQTQSQNGMDDEVSFDFVRRSDAIRCRDLVHAFVAALHPPAPTRRRSGAN